MHDLSKFHVLVVDPGLATGVSFLTYERDVAGQVRLTDLAPYEMDVPSFWSFARAKLPECVACVCETFTITAETGKKSQAPWSLELIGFLRAECFRLGIPFDMQKPGEAHEFEGNPSKARTYGLWVRGGEGHAKMSTLHAILWTVKRHGLRSISWREAGLSPCPLECYSWDATSGRPVLSKAARGGEPRPQASIGEKHTVGGGRAEVLAALKAAGYAGPTSYTVTKLREILAGMGDSGKSEKSSYGAATVDEHLVD